MMEKLLHATDVEGARIIAFMVPTRIIRILQVDPAGLTFRVEQLVEHGGFGGPQPKGAWTTLSTHGGTVAGACLGVAFESAVKHQQQLIHKLRAKIAARQPRGIIRP
jgi:hypothetical protein